MKIKSFFIHLMFLLFAIAVMPAIAQETPVVETNDSATTETEDPLSAITSVFGESGMELMAGNDELEGDIQYIMSETGDLLGLEAKNAVIMKSEKLDLECDFLRIDSVNEKITATGNVHLRIQDRTAICGRFEYDIAKSQSILTENPEIIDSDENNKSPLKVNACMIIINEDEKGKTKTIMRSCPGQDKRVHIKINRDEDEPDLIDEEGNSGAQQINLNNPGDVGRVIGAPPATESSAPPSAPAGIQTAPEPAPDQNSAGSPPASEKPSKKEEEKKEESKDLGIM